jgi:hypothetical protein
VTIGCAEFFDKAISHYVNPLKKCCLLFVALRSLEEELYEPAHPASRKNYIALT